MASSIFPTTNTTSVSTATTGALSGDGSTGNKLAVAVDGTTVDVNGSNQLQAISVISPLGEVLQIGPGGTSGNSVTLTNGATLSGALLIEGNGITVEATTATQVLDQMFLHGASLAVTYSGDTSSGDLTLIGEHMTITDDNGAQQYGLGMGGGGGDITISGGQKWLAAQGGQGGIIADYLENGVAIGGRITVTNADNTRVGVFVAGDLIHVTDSDRAYAFGRDITIDTASDSMVVGGNSAAITDVVSNALLLGHSSTIDGDTTFDTLYTLGYGHTLTATANQQMLIGFDGTTLPASEAVGVGVSSTPEIVITAGQVTTNGVGALLGVAFASLPASPVAGMYAYVTDSNTVTWGATIAGSSNNKVLAFYNGTNWTVVGK